MQQTDKYKLNLIEPTDPFLPDALNANTQRLEDVLEEKMEGPVADLEQRVTVLEGHKIVLGTYTGNSQTSQFISLDFTPKAVITSGREGFACFGAPVGDHAITIQKNGFSVTVYGSNNMNEGGRIYGFLAIV